MANWFDEEYDGSRIGLEYTRVLFSGQSDFQKVDVIETEKFGNALLLDGCWMTCEKDEKTYHEPIVHLPFAVAPSIERVLIIGGGDGGTAREVLRYKDVKHVDMVEIDGLVVEMSKKYLSKIGSSFDDPRLHVHIDDGIAWVTERNPEPYDVIIVDGADPAGPAEGLFNEAFFQGCSRCLKPNGVLTTQAESPDMMRDVHIAMIETIGRVFPVTNPYYGSVQIYPGANWSWIFASKGVQPTAVIDSRIAEVENDTWLYNRDIHFAMLAVPNHIKRAIGR